MSTSELKWKLLTKKRGSSLKVELRLPAEGALSSEPGCSCRKELTATEITMSSTQITDTGLNWSVLTIKRPGLSRDVPAGKEELMWVGNSSTLLYGEQDAVLVDTLLTTEQSQTLLDWVVASGKNLTAIYVTHGHGDHFFGLASLLKRFPHARAVARSEVVKAMQEQLSPTSLDHFWRRLFPGQIPDRLVVAEPLDENELELEGHRLIAVNTGRTDTAHSTCLHVPSIGLIVGGDVVYNGIHP
jgi:glyoxylase-like metal-dependent hydrolase (beta-lactamase superfamily II)